MNKVIKYQVVTSQNPRTLFLSVLFLFTGLVSFAQFHVKANTTFTANNVVSSKEEVNIIDASILGEDELVLNGQDQVLETAKKTSLATLRVVNGNELQIRTEIKLRGDLVVEAGVLNLAHPVHVGGGVILENDAKVHNDFFIIYENKFVFEEGFATAVMAKVFQSTAVVLQINKSESSVFIEIEKPFFGFKENRNNPFKCLPFSPPPESGAVA